MVPVIVNSIHLQQGKEQFELSVWFVSAYQSVGVSIHYQDPLTFRSKWSKYWIWWFTTKPMYQCFVSATSQTTATGWWNLNLVVILFCVELVDLFNTYKASSSVKNSERLEFSKLEQDYIKVVRFFSICKASNPFILYFWGFQR